MKLFLVLLLSLSAVAVPISAGEAARYLTGSGVDLVEFISPAPEKGSLLEKRDLRVFRGQRGKVGSERWQLATADVDESIAAILNNFSASAGMDLSPGTHPKLTHLVVKLRQDVIAAVDAAKPQYRRLRPFQIVNGPVCQPTEELKTFDYPSGHTSYGTTVAFVLVELLPDRAGAILERGREYGESRVICGAHSVSAVDAGRQAAGAILAALHGSAEFRIDLEAARDELAGIK